MIFKMPPDLGVREADGETAGELGLAVAEVAGEAVVLGAAELAGADEAGGFEVAGAAEVAGALVTGATAEVLGAAEVAGAVVEGVELQPTIIREHNNRIARGRMSFFILNSLFKYFQSPEIFSIKY